MPVDVLARFGLVVGSILGVAGALITVVERLRRRRLMSSVLGQRWLTWLGLSVLWLFAVSSGPARLVVLASIGMAAGFEYARLTGMTNTDRALTVALPVAALLITRLTSLGPALTLVLLATTLSALYSQDIDRGVARTSKLALGVVVAVLPVMALEILGSNRISVMVAALFGVALSDVCAFVAGSMFGSRTLAPVLSPNKTWEGVLGNLVGAFVGVTLSGIVFPLPLPVVLLLPLLIAIGAVWGDLFESLLKRAAGVKDAGRILPGFGGILDRIDSLIVAAPIVFVAGSFGWLG